MGKKLTLEKLRAHYEDIDQRILRTRKILETHAGEREKLYSPENRRRLSPQGLLEDEMKLRRKTEISLATLNAAIAREAREAFAGRDSWTYEATLRNSRFVPESAGIPGTTEAQRRAFDSELLEALRRNGAENRAARYATEDLITEAERAALAGEVATLAVLSQEARSRKLGELDKLNFDTACKKLRLPEIDEAQALFTELEGLAQEADALFTLWKEPNNPVAQGHESLGRLNRRKKAEEFVKKTLEAEAEQQRAASEPEQSSAA